MPGTVMIDENQRAGLAMGFVAIWANLDAQVRIHNADVAGAPLPLDAPNLELIELLKQYRRISRWLRDNPIRSDGVDDGGAQSPVELVAESDANVADDPG